MDVQWQDAIARAAGALGTCAKIAREADELADATAILKASLANLHDSKQTELCVLSCSYKVVAAASVRLHAASRAGGRSASSQSPILELAALATHSKFCKRGHARQLVDLLKVAAGRHLGVRSIVVCAADDTAVAFWQRVGFFLHGASAKEEELLRESRGGTHATASITMRCPLYTPTPHAELAAAGWLTSGHAFVGKRGKRSFGSGAVGGTFVAWARPDAGNAARWRLVHDDGDEEDLAIEDVLQALESERTRGAAGCCPAGPQGGGALRQHAAAAAAAGTAARTPPARGVASGAGGAAAGAGAGGGDSGGGRGAEQQEWHTASVAGASGLVTGPYVGRRVRDTLTTL
jgi:N-acetylglutamate synthase-like GNAT family acetyltransferase